MRSSSLSRAILSRIRHGAAVALFHLLDVGVLVRLLDVGVLVHLLDVGVLVPRGLGSC